MDMPRKRSLRRNVKDISKRAEELVTKAVVKKSAADNAENKPTSSKSKGTADNAENKPTSSKSTGTADNAENKPTSSKSKGRPKIDLAKPKSSLDSQNSETVFPSSSKQFDKHNFMVTVYKDNIDTIHPSAQIASPSSSDALFNSHNPIITLNKVALNASTNEYETVKTPNRRSKSVSFNEDLRLANSSKTKSKEKISKVKRLSTPSPNRGEKILRRSLGTPAKVGVLNTNKKEDSPIKSNASNSLNIGTTVADVETTPKILSSLNLSSTKKSNISSAKSKSKTKKGVRFGDQIIKKSESDVCLLSDASTTKEKDVVSLISSDDRGNLSPVSLNGPSTPESLGSKSPRKKATKKKKAQKELDFSSSDDETIASFISRKSTPKKDTKINKSKDKSNAKGRKRKLSDKEITPRKMRKQMSPKKMNKNSASPKRVLAEQKDQGESQENEDISNNASAPKKSRRTKKPTGKENKSTKGTKRNQKSMETKEPGVSDANDTLGSCRTEESFPNNGDMPLITFSTSPATPKQPRTRIKKEGESTDGVAKPPSQRGRKRTLDEDGTQKKKRGRKKVKKEAVFLEANQRAEITEDEDLEDEEEGGPDLIRKKKSRKKTQRRTGRRFSVTGNWYIASGYLNDIISLLEEFDNIKSWRFKDFSACWRSKMFSLVYRGRQTFKELLEFSEEIALLTKRFLSPPHSIKRRVGALYTLYGLYYKFPLGKRQFFNLRFELREYEELLSLIFPFRTNVDNPDPAYIFRKLELDGAILHCATAFEPCYDFHNEERDYVELEYGKEKLAKSSAVSNAIPLIQLKADMNLLQHYHSVKAKVAGQEDPEKALKMITPEFLEGIYSNLTHLRKNTLDELGMSEDQMNRSMKAEDDPERTEINEDDLLRSDLTNGEIELYSIGKKVLNTVNNCEKGVKSRKNLENNQLVTDEEVRDFMRPPTAEELQQPLLFKSKRGRKPKKGPNYSMDWNKKDEDVKKESVDGEEWDGKVLLDVDEELGDLTKILLPQPLPAKKKRKPKRPAALLREASFPSKRTPNKKAAISINKRLMDESADNEDENQINGEDNSEPQPSVSLTATRLLVTDLPDMKQKTPDTIVKVRMRADGIRKVIKLKIKVSPDQFNEIRKSPVRYKNFKLKLMPLIKMTQKNDNKDKDWQIEEIFLHKEEKETNKNAEDENETNTSIPEVDVEQSPKKVVPFKMKYECLRHSEDEEEDEVIDDDEDLFPCKWKTEEDKDGDYDPPPDVDEEEEEPLEYQYEGLDDEYDDFIPEKNYFWRKSRERRSHYYGDYFEERGPRDSDNLLKPRTGNSVAMIPMRVGGTLKYFPMIKTNETRQPPVETTKEPEPSTSKGEEEVLPIDPEDTNAIFTWNDFSSDKSPPFKKKRASKSFSYIFSPKLPLLKDNSERSLRRVSSTTTIKPLIKKSVEESSEVENVTEETPKTPEKPAMNIKEKAQHEENGELIVNIKKEMSVLEELAGDWDDEESTSGTRRATPVREKQQEEDPLKVHNSSAENSPLKVSENSLTNSKNVVYVEDDSVYSLDEDVDIVDATDFHTEEDLGVQDDAYDVAYFQSPTKNDFNGSYIEGIDDIQEISILPHNSVLNTSYEKDVKDFQVPVTTATHFNGSHVEGVSNIQETAILPHISMPSTSYENGGNNLPLPVTPTTTTVAPGELIMNESITTEQGVPRNRASQVMDLNLSDKQPLYYKMMTADGNNVFIPISSLPEAPQKNIEILSFDVEDVKPFLPNVDSVESSFVAPVFDTSVSGNQTYPFSSSLPQNDNILAENIVDHMLNQSSHTNDIGFTPSQQTNQSLSIDAASTNDFNETKPSCSFFNKVNKNITPKPSSKPLNDVANTPLNNASQPACAFFFSSRLKGTLGNMISAKGIASGRTPKVEAPKVKFLMKGFFGSGKKK